ncbi:NAD(P)/FAD-dependent oxidoreductase [Streptomyces sp. GESEQ-35]|uniref:NAD(P)/FAD-dependent oxidoreductase n=1 Tax=Streptomyces sp. GESEQ-35 TaxID=2812657 RepID=UPI001FF24B92|nr:NAD(P)-binding protein [Streptomyces sp. GESEQ-35]
MQVSTRDRALVIGSGIAGLAVARVLADHFREVVILEREWLPGDGVGRTGVPQARHVHGLLAAGAARFEELFPGLGTELAEAGALVFDFGDESVMLLPPGRVPASTAGLLFRSSSRDLLEAQIRRRVKTIGHVRVETGVSATALLTGPSPGSVAGVAACVHRPGVARQFVEYQADLTVDCSGRFSQCPRWLDELGYPPLTETVVDSGLAYASRMYKGPALEWKALYQPLAACGQPRGVYITRIEDGQWLVTLLGVTGHHPPTDEDGFLSFAASLDNPELAHVLASSHPISAIHRFARTENRRRELRRGAAWPDGFVEVGDAVCAFNPVYGQGMTVACHSALTLHRSLLRHDADLTGFSRSFQRSLRGVHFWPWLMSTSEDRIWAAAREQRTDRLSHAVQWYKNRLFTRIIHDPVTRQAFLLVFHSLRRPTALARPQILARVLLARNPRRSLAHDPGHRTHPRRRLRR